MDDFTPIDAGAVDMARRNALAAARARRQNNPAFTNTAESFERQAAELLTVRNKILDLLPLEFHQHRKAYPDYCAKERAGVD